MRKESLNIHFQDFRSADDLEAGEAQLLDKALEASKLAYAPHSGFFVGAAVLLENGEIITGNNQENKAFPSGLCAERTALFHIGASGKGDQILKIAIRARSNSIEVNSPPTPCGGCRQVMLEYENLSGRPIVVLMQGESGNILRLNGIAQTLLPFSFDIDF